MCIIIIHRPKHPHTVSTSVLQHQCFKFKKNYEKAKQLHRQALEGREESLGKGHPDTLTGIKAMGAVLPDRESVREGNGTAIEEVK